MIRNFILKQILIQKQRSSRFPKTKNGSERFGFVFWSLTGAVLYGGCPGYGGGSIEGTGEAVGAAMFRLVVISGTGVTGNQTGTGEMTCRTRDCRRGDQKKKQKKEKT